MQEASTTNSPSAVIFLSTVKNYSPSAVVTAQAYAKRQGLPFAVAAIVSVEELHKHSQKLFSIESALYEFSIPFLTFVGLPVDRLNAIKAHIAPIIFVSEAKYVGYLKECYLPYSIADSNSDQGLTRCTIAWPGPAISVSALLDLYPLA